MNATEFEADLTVSGPSAGGHGDDPATQGDTPIRVNAHAPVEGETLVAISAQVGRVRVTVGMTDGEARTLAWLLTQAADFAGGSPP